MFGSRDRGADGGKCQQHHQRHREADTAAAGVRMMDSYSLA